MNKGKKIGPYTLLEELGRGGQTVVYLAREQGVERCVALKVLLEGSFAGWRSRARFKREAETIARLNHRNICVVHRTGEAEGVPFLAMEHVEGKTLAHGLRKAREAGLKPPFVPAAVGSPAVEDCLAPLLLFMEKTARALHAAHAAGIIHRDVKPANIMVTPEGEPVLLDFGMARVEDQEHGVLSLTGQPLGTPAYMPPEQIQPGLHRLDGRADLYALGATLYECLTFNRPHQGVTRDSIYQSILTRSPPEIRLAYPGAPADLCVIVATALAREPDCRYRNALELAEDLRRLRCSEPILARRVSGYRRFRLWARRNPAPAVAGTAIFAVLVIGLLVTLGLLHLTEKEIQENRRYTDLRMFPYLEQVEQHDLWPTRPEKVPEMEQWLTQARGLLSRMTEDQPGSRALQEKVRAVAERRLKAAEWARVTYDQYGAAWRETVAAIADERLSPRYAGLEINVQFGLVPIGRDPRSGLYEFADIQTGSVPRRDSQTGQLLLEEGMGLVFVLIPGGAFTMGAVRAHAAGKTGQANLDPRARENEGPLHEVALEAFFLSKYEMTLGQWQKITGERNPSLFAGGQSQVSAHGAIATPLHPVMGIHGDRFLMVMEQHGFTLPTEAQWEYAARAGTSTVWWSGDREASLEGVANLMDQTKAEQDGDGVITYDCLPWKDGYYHTAPVGSFRANGFGLHDVLGNVIELVRDRYGSYDRPVRAGDGLRQVDAARFRVTRGGGIYSTASACRIAGRNITNPSYSNLGFRPAREVNSRDIHKIQ